MEDSGAATLFIDGEKPPTITSKKEYEEDVKNEECEPHGWTPLLLLGGATCCLGSALPAGFNIGVVNNPAQIMQNFCNESIKTQYNVDLSVNELKLVWSVVVSIFLIGGVTGSLVASWIADKFGRKGGLALGNLFGIVGAFFFLATPASNSVILLIVGRLLVGFSGGIATSLQPMYLMEIAPLKQRGAVGVLCQLGITVGVFLGQIAGLDSVLGTKEHWHLMLACYAPLCVIAIAVLFILPESPKYLFIIKQQREKAIQELKRLRQENDEQEMFLQQEIRALQEEATSNATMDTWHLGRVLKDPSVRLPLLLVSALQLGQQLSGINAVFYYSTDIFLAAKLTSTESQYATLGTGVINILMAVISVRIMSHFGRRTLWFCSCYLSALSLAVLAIGIININLGAFMPWLCIIAVQLYVLFYGIGLGPIPYFIGSELFDVGPRPAAMAVGSVCNWGGNFIVGLLFQVIAGAIEGYTYFIFVVIIGFLILFTRRYLPETRGIDTTIIALQLCHGFKSQRMVHSNA